MNPYEVLSHYFGYSSFRPGQEELIGAILSGKDALGIMPTGGGKSLCYEVPALVMQGLTVVISPLISLMQDQVMALKTAGVPACCLTSVQAPEERNEVYWNLRHGTVRLLYVAPERLEGEGFVSLMASLPISLVAVDEAHCISQWGQDFRPSYLRIPDFIDALPMRPTLAAFTATATKQVREDIRRMLRLREPVEVLTGFDRPNLFYDVKIPDNKMSALFSELRLHTESSGIIYCSTRKGVEQVCSALQENGFQATRYHAGLPETERQKNQTDFIYDRARIMVATNAFGMGIDKPNVRFVIHYNMPKSLEAYYQEAGRAGRDGESATCTLLYSPGDVKTAQFLIQNGGENEALSPEEREQVQKKDMARLSTMVRYCRTTNCLRGAILDYFGQSRREKCENCGNCKSDYPPQNITIPAQKILSCVRRISDKLGYNLGASMVIQTLRGGRSTRLLELGLDTLTTYGIMRETSTASLKMLVEALEREGYLVTDPEHGALRLTKAAGDVLFRKKQVVVSLRMPSSKEKQKTGTVSYSKDDFSPEDKELLSRLAVLRSRFARDAGVPDFFIFNSASLNEMVIKKPKTRSEFLRIPGVGEYKTEKYGADFLQEIRKGET